MENFKEQERLDYLKSNSDMTIDECIAKIAEIKKLYELMCKGIVAFRFRKKDGTIRSAKGTLNFSDIQYEFKGGAEKNVSLMPYWDVEKNAFRSFSLLNFIGIGE